MKLSWKFRRQNNYQVLTRNKKKLEFGFQENVLIVLDQNRRTQAIFHRALLEMFSEWFESTRFIFQGKSERINHVLTTRRWIRFTNRNLYAYKFVALVTNSFRWNFRSVIQWENKKQRAFHDSVNFSMTTVSRLIEYWSERNFFVKILCVTWMNNLFSIVQKLEFGIITLNTTHYLFNRHMNFY